MSKSQELSTISNENSSLISSLGFDPFEDGNFAAGFQDQTVEFFNPTGLEGVEMEVYLQEEQKLEIKGEEKTFAVGFIKMATGVKRMFFGQHQIYTCLQRNDKGKGVLAKIVFTGKSPIKNSAKTLNNFDIFAKAL